MTTGEALLAKYNVPVPRYTSYPTVPFWKDGMDATAWGQVFQQDFEEGNKSKGISLYIHLPFCESLCTYCGCNKKITQNHSVETEYIAAILKEWKIYRQLMNEPPIIRELHLGGGTPTFFSPQNLELLLGTILKDCLVHPEHEFSFEGHPNNTTRAHLEQLYNSGFRRVSFGVQDNDPAVQRIINRIQPLENVQRVTEMARSIGYKSVNFDLIYGLPLQTATSIERTITETIALRPDRVAFYSYAHVPWTSRGQRLFDENDLPTAGEKIQLYQIGRKLFTDNGYVDIGMDHFSLPEDDLHQALKRSELHRSFMGYTTQQSEILLGLGVSAISNTPNAYAQNDKTIHNYYNYINSDKPAIVKGCFLTEEDRRFGKYIMEISCKGETSFDPQDNVTINEYCMPLLKPMQADDIITLRKGGLNVTAKERTFVRNICSAFDLYLLKSRMDKEKKLFSKAI